MFVVYNHFFQSMRIYHILFFIDNIPSGFYNHSERQSTLPVRIDSLNKFINIIIIEDKVSVGSLLFLKESEGVGFSCLLVGAYGYELKLASAIHPVNDNQIGKLRYAGTAPCRPDVY